MMKSLFLVTALLSSGVASASTHAINIKPVRDFVQDKVLGKNRLKLTSRLNEAHPSAGVSAKAVLKAHQTLVGLQGFNSGSHGANYVRKMGAAKVIFSAVTAHDRADYDTMIQRFVVRSDKQGLVLARGYVKDGAITWTRSHNEHATTTPAERNAAE